MEEDVFFYAGFEWVGFWVGFEGVLGAGPGYEGVFVSGVGVGKGRGGGR